MLTSTPVSTRDGVIRRVRTGYGTTGATTGAVDFGATVFVAFTFLVGFAEAVGATDADAGAVGAAVTGTAGRVTGAGATGLARTTGGVGVFDGRAGVTCWTVVGAAPASALAAGRAEGDAKTLTSTIAR
jgi:hypothetical protein